MKAKDPELDEQRLKKLNAIDSGGVTHGGIPLDRYTLDHAQEAKRPATRRQYAQLINRVLSLAVFPCRYIKVNRFPKGSFLVPGSRRPTVPLPERGRRAARV